MPTRGVTFARYLRKVHIEWCPFKPKAVGPVFFGEIHTKQIFDAVPKLAITKALVAAPTKEGARAVRRSGENIFANSLRCSRRREKFTSQSSLHGSLGAR